MRKAVPAVVAVALAVIVVASVFNPFRILSKLPIDINKLAVQGTKITMESPHLAGFTSDQRPYELWAKSATQDVSDPNNVELHELRAKVQMEDKTGVTMDARTGLFDSKTQLLDLKEDIFLQSTTGYEARLTQASVDFAAGTVSSDEPVAVKLLNGTLDAKSLRITEGGALVKFDGGVTMILIPEGANKSGETGVSSTPAAKDQAADTAAPIQESTGK
ncbi:MAG: LPS export ABC transporter periplasmic protein LptC [Afipia sp.]|nr:LPS export ABC transporter periplasmic protein LptC [Afipia sp.]